jgi:phosphoserine phosphatase RsbU/P
MSEQTETEPGIAPVSFHFMTASRKGTSFAIETAGEYRFGRDPECEVHLPEANVSRVHARALWDGVALTMEDLKSTNGVFVNGERLPSCTVRDGDVVAIGPCVFRVHVAAEPSVQHVDIADECAATAVMDDGRTQFQSLFECMLAIQRIVSEDSGSMVEQCLETVFVALPVNRLCLLKLSAAGELEPWFSKTKSGITREFVMSKTFARKVREAGKGIVIHDALHLDSREWGHTMQQQEVRSILGVPVFDANTMIAILLCDNLEAPNILRDEHVRTLEFFARALGTVFQRERIRTLEASQAATERQFLAAKRVQKQIFTKRPSLLMGGMQWGLAFHPALEVGGDFYDFEERHDGVTWVVADVTGKGISAALVVSMLKGFCKTLFPENPAPRDMLMELNTLLLGELPPEMFLTAVVMQANRDGTVCCGNAGHLPLLIVPKTGEPDSTIRRIKPAGIPLGFLPDEEFTERIAEETFGLRPGERVYLCTDGVTEAASAAGDFFGEKRLFSSIDSCRGMAVQEAVSTLVRTIQGFQGTAPQHDDITVVCGEYHPS